MVQVKESSMKFERYYLQLGSGDVLGACLLPPLRDLMTSKGDSVLHAFVRINGLPKENQKKPVAIKRCSDYRFEVIAFVPSLELNYILDIHVGFQKIEAIYFIKRTQMGDVENVPLNFLKTEEIDVLPSTVVV